MKVRLKGFQELIEWGFEALADRLGIQRRHVLFGLFVLFLSTLVTGWYIYEKNWVIQSKRNAGRNEQQMTISLNGEDSAVQEMSKQIRESILDTPMAAAASAQSMAESAASQSAQRSEPQDNSASQSASASTAASSAPSASGASRSSFSPSISPASSSSVMAGQARAENSQSMRMSVAQPVLQSATGRNAARSTPQATSVESASASSNNTPDSLSASGKSTSLSPSATQAASTSVQASEARAESSQSMSSADVPAAAQQAASGHSSARSTPQATAAQSASVSRQMSAVNAVRASGNTSALSPATTTQASSASVQTSDARAESSRNMSAASSQSLAQAATGSRGSSRNTPSASVSQGSASVQASNSATAVSGSSGLRQSLSPSVSGSRAAVNGVRSDGAKAVASRNMAGVSVVASSQASSGARGIARRGQSERKSNAGSSVAAANSGAMPSRASAADTFRPSISSIRTAGPVVRSNGSVSAEASSRPMVSSSRSRLGGSASDASSQIMLQAGSRALAGPVDLRGRRSRPRSTYVTRPGKTGTSVTSSVSVASLGNPNIINSYTPSMTKIRSSVPTVRESRSRPVSSMVEVTPPPSSFQVKIPFPRPKPTLVKSINPQTNPVKSKPVNPYEKRFVKPELRAAFVRKQGGGPETESAVALALEWLKKTQRKDGYWPQNHGHTTASTGLAMMAFMGWGAKHTESGPYQEVLRKAIEWTMEKERNGDLRHRGDMYDHGIAAIALAEAYNLTHDERLREPVQRMVDFTIKAQNPLTGGWRYKTYHENPRDKGDLSVTGWQLMALKSARLGGIKVPEEVFTRARGFLAGVTTTDQGYKYQPGRKPSNAMIAEGLFCEQILREGGMNEQMKRSTTLIQSSLPKSSTVDYYYWYYGSLAMRQAQGEAWNAWNDRLKPILLKKQILTGSNRGSWIPQGNKHGYASIAGPVVTTAMAALSLEVYYRYLPLYSPEWSKTEK